jgi:hypothetical protein
MEFVFWYRLQMEREYKKKMRLQPHRPTCPSYGIQLFCYHIATENPGGSNGDNGTRAGRFEETGNVNSYETAAILEVSIRKMEETRGTRKAIVFCYKTAFQVNELTKLCSGMYEATQSVRRS